MAKRDVAKNSWRRAAAQHLADPSSLFVMEPSTPGTGRADCSRCAGLCCVGLAFDRSPLFAFGKPAGAPCRHLTPANRCRVHDRLESTGLAGCARYDCGGAGQRVTAELFPGRSWRDGPDTARAMLDAFRALREIDELRLLLSAARRLPLAARHTSTLAGLAGALDDPPGGWSPATLERLERGPLPARIRAFLRSLRWQVGGTSHIPARPSFAGLCVAPVTIDDR